MRRLLTATAVLFALTLAAPVPTGAERDGRLTPRGIPENAPPALRLGLRSLHLEQAIPVVDRVVIVPDEATFLDEIAQWSLDGHWPVLMADDRLVPMFIRRFDPAEVIQRESIADEQPLPRETEARRAAMEAAVIRAWGGDPETDALLDLFRRHGHTPAGVVITREAEPARLAAVALAAGRGQPIGWVDKDYGSPNAVVDREVADAIAARVEAILTATDVPYHTLDGRGIDTVTLCLHMPGRVRLPRADNNEIEPAAMTDYIGRDGADRFAYTGWIFADLRRGAYIAMCSLFLPRESVWLVNTYPDQDQWRAYGMGGAAQTFEGRGYTVQRMSGVRAAPGAWLTMLAGGIDPDVFVMNSRGNVDFFHLSSGRMTPADLPVLNVPAAVHFTHSWSMREPDRADTVAGTWLRRGAYAYVGSVHEPYLLAFVPPDGLAERWTNAVPFLVAARHWEGPDLIAGPWKVNTFGDPLMLMAPPEQTQRNRVRRPADQGIRLTERVRELIRGIDEPVSEDERGQRLAEAMRLLDWLGRDETARGLWHAAEDRGLESHAAPWALGPLFRLAERDAFMSAWSFVGHHDPHRLDMLWHLMTPRLGSLRNEDHLLMMQAAIRPHAAASDVERLTPALSRVFGADHARGLIEREIERAEDRSTRRALERLLRDFD